MFAKITRISISFRRIKEILFFEETLIMILIIDNYDSFTYNLVSYFEILGCEVCVKRNDEISVSECLEMSPEAIVVSPGPKTPLEAGVSIDVFQKLCGRVPILGVCLGHQTLAFVRGIEVIESGYPMHGKITEIIHDSNGVFRGMKNPIKVMRYHSLIVDKKLFEGGHYNGLQITSQTSDGVIMGLRDSQNKIETVQFHPESIGTEQGIDMISNFLKWIR